LFKGNGIPADIAGEIINIGSDEEIVTIINLAERIATSCRFNLNPVFVAWSPQEVTNAICSSDRARKLLDYKLSSISTPGCSI